MRDKYMNPYQAGFLLGLVLLTTIFVTGRGLGASGVFKSVVVTAVEEVAPAHAETQPFFQQAHHAGQSPLKSWLVFESLGLVLGAFISGVISHRLTFVTEHAPHITKRQRLVAALIGGMLFGIGAMFARGCTSGAALSGLAVLSVGGLMTMGAIFGSAYGVAWFFRRLWI
ncbi:MAG: YeeE/YedE family protein [Planctomycetales bacterium]|nr:YeeE/YedE family protein [Planctomycetales bacterium]